MFNIAQHLNPISKRRTGLFAVRPVPIITLPIASRFAAQR
jgi:hypothetical protein